MAKKYLRIDLYNGRVANTTEAEFKADALVARELEIEPEIRDGHVSYHFEEELVVEVDLT